MFATHTPSESYKQIGVETGVMSASPHKLILMLFEGALMSLAVARESMEKNNIDAKGKAISKAIDILANGLKASLDMEKGGEISERLVALYDYMCDRLIYSNIHNDLAAIDEVRRLLQEIKVAWEEIARDPAVVSDSTRKE
jgi:flagellar protein FliS